MGKKCNGISASTVVLGYLDGMEISFSIGDVKLTEGQKGKRQTVIASNLRKLDEEKPDPVPKTISLCDSRLTNLSVPKEKICNFLRTPLGPVPNTTTTIDQKRRKPNIIKMNPRRNC